MVKFMFTMGNNDRADLVRQLPVLSNPPSDVFSFKEVQERVFDLFLSFFIS